MKLSGDRLLVTEFKNAWEEMIDYTFWLAFYFLFFKFLQPLALIP